MTHATLFDLEGMEPGVLPLMDAPEFPRHCRLHPEGAGYSCRYGVCERSADIEARRRAGEDIGVSTVGLPLGTRIRDIYWLDEYVIEQRKKDHIWLRVDRPGPGRSRLRERGKLRDQYEPGDRRYEVLAVGGGA